MNLEEAKLRKVDTRGGKAPHARHLAIINRILVCGYKPKPGERGDVLNGEVAATRCGKMLRKFNTADDTSLRDSEGGVYSVECPRCFEGFEEPARRVVMFRAYKSASAAALFVSTVSAPDDFFRVWRPDSDVDSWRVNATNPTRVPEDRERLSVTAPELTPGVLKALNGYFTSKVAIE